MKSQVGSHQDPRSPGEPETRGTPLSQLGAYAKRHTFFLLIVAGLGVAVYQSARVTWRLQARLEQVRLEAAPRSVRVTLPSVLSPMTGTDLDGRRQELRYEAEKTLLCIFNPDLPNFDSELEVWNRIADGKQAGLSVVGLATSERGLARLLLFQEVRFPVVIVQSFEELERNSIGYVPGTVLVSRGGRLQKFWFGYQSLEKPENREELAEALAFAF